MGAPTDGFTVTFRQAAAIQFSEVKKDLKQALHKQLSTGINRVDQSETRREYLPVGSHSHPCERGSQTGQPDLCQFVTH